MPAICALLPPHRTGRADFPHPALLKALASGFRKFHRLLLGLLAQLRPQCREFLRDGYSPAPRKPLHHLFRFFRSRTFLVQAVLLTFRLKHSFSKAPSLLGHYPASSLLWASPTPAQARFPVMFSLQLLAPERVSQVPRLFFRRTPSPYTPESPVVALSRFFTSGSGFTISGRLATLTCLSRPFSGSLALRLTSLPPKASPRWITPSCARSATCVTGNSHDELLSVH